MLYAEGAADVGSGPGLPPPPLAEIWDEALGPAHLLIRRVVADAWSIPEAAVRFVSPLRHKAMVIRGSMLLDREILRRAATFADPTKRPDLVVLLVDGDGDPARRSKLEGHIADLPSRPIVACAEPELEAWLLGDVSAVRALAGAVDVPSNVESLPPRGAKDLLNDRLSDRPNARSSLAQSASLEAIVRSCASFSSFVSAIRARKPG